MDDEQGFARPDMAEGYLWIETPQTMTAMMALFSLLDVARRDEPVWQPYWVLCGPEGTGKTALARRFASQAQRSSACDAVREAEERHAAEMRTPKIPSPSAFGARDFSWDRYRAFQAMSPEERVRRFGDCPNVCRPAEFLPAAALEQALERAGEACPVGIGTMRPRTKDVGDIFYQGTWASSGNRQSDPVRRTSVFFVDDADHLTRLNPVKRGGLLEEMRDWPRAKGIEHPVSLVLIGTPALADAVAECGEVRRIDLPPMALDGPAGTFARTCRLIFGTQDADDLERLHRGARGAIGPLLTMARLQGLDPPYCIGDDEILRLPAPEED